MTITALTIRQFLKSRSIAVIAVICLIPILVAIVPHLTNSEPSLRSLRSMIGDTIFLNLYTTLLLPISVTVLAAAAFGDEIEDKTLYILALKPIARWRIVLEKFLAVVLVAVPVLWISTGASWAVVSWGHLDEMKHFIWPMFAACLVGICGFGSIFLAVSLYMRRTLLFGMFYVAIWEGTLSRFLPGIRSFSISHYSQSIFTNLLDDRRIGVDDPASTTQVVITIAIIVVIALSIATMRLRKMAID